MLFVEELEQRQLLALSVVPVPYVQGNPEIPHPAFVGANTTLKAVVRGATSGHAYKVV